MQPKLDTVKPSSFDFAGFFLDAAGPGETPSPFQRELRLIESLDDIRNPPDCFKAEELC